MVEKPVAETSQMVKLANSSVPPVQIMAANSIMAAYAIKPEQSVTIWATG